MTEIRGPITILMADDDDDDFLLTQTALNDAHLLNNLQRVSDGEQVLDYLRRRAPYDDHARYPEPALILLGVNSFIRKPVSFESLTRVIGIMGHYWFETVVLPEARRAARRA